MTRIAALLVSRRIFGIGFLLLLTCGSTWAGDKEAVKTLTETPLFAFGGIGYAGTTWRGEIAFRDVLASDTAAADFLKVIKAGTPEAQCYALFGLRLKDRAAYDEQIKRFVSSSQEVQTCFGCMMSKQHMSAVVADIRNGAYEKRMEASRPKR